MATLTGQTIADSYEQILHVDRNGGGNTSSLVNIKDGDNGTTFCASMNDASTAKSILSIDGSHASGTALYIDNSATDGDVSVEWQLGGTTTWLMGIEDGDSDSLKICQSDTMGTDERLSFLAASTVFNEDSSDIDFRVEGNGEDTLLFCDASTDRVSIGGDATPAFLLTVGDTADTEDAELGIQCGSDNGDTATLYLGNGTKSYVKTTYTNGEQDMQFGVTNGDGAVLAMTIDEDGQVGIGTSSPVVGATVGVDIENTTTNSTTEGGCLRLGANDGTVMVANDRLGAIEFAGAEDGSGTMIVGARIEAVAMETWDASNNGATLDFYTTEGNNDATQRMTILADGKVGIGGDATPAYLLTVGDSASDTDAELGIQCTAATGAKATLWMGSGGKSGIKSTVDGTGSQELTFWTWNGSAGPAATVQAMTLMDEGDMGIREATPSKMLDVGNGASGADILCEDIFTHDGNAETSDQRMKENIIDSALGLNFVNALKPRSFKWKDTDEYTEGGQTYPAHEYTRTHYGMISQEVKQVMDDSGLSAEDFAGWGYEDDRDIYILRYTEFISPLIKAVQELSAKVTALENA